MIDKNIASEIVKACKEYVGLQIAALVERVDTLTGQIKSLPAPKDGVDGKHGAQGPEGPAGAAGEPGERGPAGVDGKDGAPGAAGRDGVDGKDGAPGLEGRAGADGAPGAAGRDGEDGRDGLEIDVLSAIDETRRYRRGTWASHKGGVWRATRTTEGLDGWECILRGIAGVEVTHEDDGRTVREKHILSDGSEFTHTRFVPIMIYRGVFRDGEAYQQGDTVTFGGSLWHCNAETGQPPRETDQVWTLATKRGRDGKSIEVKK